MNFCKYEKNFHTFFSNYVKNKFFVIKMYSNLNFCRKRIFKIGNSAIINSLRLAWLISERNSKQSTRGKKKKK
jgi:hypothetical protein